MFDFRELFNKNTVRCSNHYCKIKTKKELVESGKSGSFLGDLFFCKNCTEEMYEDLQNKIIEKTVNSKYILRIWSEYDESTHDIPGTWKELTEFVDKNYHTKIKKLNTEYTVNVKSGKNHYDVVLEIMMKNIANRGRANGRREED